MSAQLLLVDDEPSLREAVQAYLEDSGFTVRVARDATEGWEMVQQFAPDLVISDVMMPKVELAHIRESEAVREHIRKQVETVRRARGVRELDVADSDHMLN